MEATVLQEVQKRGLIISVNPEIKTKEGETSKREFVKVQVHLHSENDTPLYTKTGKKAVVTATYTLGISPDSETGYSKEVSDLNNGEIRDLYARLVDEGGIKTWYFTVGSKGQATTEEINELFGLEEGASQPVQATHGF